MRKPGVWQEWGTRGGDAVALFAILWFVFVVVCSAWQCDDAYITFRTVENLWHGLGLVWNPGERVQSYSSPLWMFVAAILRGISGEVYFSDLGRFDPLRGGDRGPLRLRNPAGPAAGGARSWRALSTSAAVVDYATSGLENPLLHLLLILVLIEARQAGFGAARVPHLAADGAGGPHAPRRDSLRASRAGLGGVAAQAAKRERRAAVARSLSPDRLGDLLARLLRQLRPQHGPCQARSRDPAVGTRPAGAALLRRLRPLRSDHPAPRLRGHGSELLEGTRGRATRRGGRAPLPAVRAPDRRRLHVRPFLRGAGRRRGGIARLAGVAGRPHRRRRSDAGSGERVAARPLPLRRCSGRTAAGSRDRITDGRKPAIRWCAPSGIADERAYYYVSTGLLRVLVTGTRSRRKKLPVPPYRGAFLGREFSRARSA